MFQIFMPIDQIIDAFAEAIPLIHTKLDVVLLNALPMNIFKGFVISLLTMKALFINGSPRKKFNTA